MLRYSLYIGGYFYIALCLGTLLWQLLTHTDDKLNKDRFWTGLAALVWPVTLLLATIIAIPFGFGYLCDRLGLAYETLVSLRIRGTNAARENSENLEGASGRDV